MAENVKRYGAGAVYGSLAYDFSNPALQPDLAEEAQWRVQHQTRTPVLEEERSDEKAAAKNLQAIAPLSVIGIAFAAVMIVIMLLAQVRLTAVCNEAVQLTNKIEALETEQNRLRIAFESAFNLNEIEEYAVEELGMQKPRSDQIICIDSAAHDKVEVFRTEGSEDVLDRVLNFVGSVGEYLG